MRGPKKFVEKRTDCKTRFTALLDQSGVSYDESLWDEQSLEFLAEVGLEDPRG